MTTVRNFSHIFSPVRQTFVLLCFLQMLPYPAFGQDDGHVDGSNSNGLLMDILWPGDLHLTIGGGPRYAPDYFGSDDYEWAFREVYSLRFKDKVTVDNEGISLGLFELSDFTIGPTANITGGRKDEKNTALNGLGDVGVTFELGVFAKAKFNDRYAVRFRYRHAIQTGHRGGIFDGQASARIYKRGALSAGVSVRGTWVDKDYAKAFFGVSPEQAARSGIPEFSAGRTARDVRGSLVLRWGFAENWALNGYAKYNRLLGDAADTPIVSDFGSRNQFAVGAFASYTFTFD